MSSIVYFKFKANVKTDSIPFDGSSISVKDLKTAIRTKCCLYSSDFDLKLEDTTGKAYTKDDELIPKYTSIVVRRVPRLAPESQKKKPPAPEDLPWREIQRNQQLTGTDAQQSQKHVNLADSDLPEEEKIKLMMERSSESYSEKNFAVKAKPYGVPPAAYICHKCGLPGHWIHNCPGVRDKTGKMMDVKSVKRPTGIPQDFLLEVDAGTPGAYLGKSGKYMVPIKDAEAYALGKKDKRPFSVEENPPYVPKERTPPKQFICPLCSELFKDAVLVSCCGTTYCNECIMGHVFDAEVLGSHKCPNCGAVLTDHESSVFENALVRSMIRDWLANEKVVPESDVGAIQNDALKLDEVDKTFVNNRRVLKPKQAALNSVPPQAKYESLHEVPSKTETKASTASEPLPAGKKEPTMTTQSEDTKPKDSLPSPSVPLVASPHDSESAVELTVTTIRSPIVTPNTSATVVASAPCTTLVRVSSQPMLTVTSDLSSSQFPCMSYTNSAAIMPTMLPSINGTSNPLLNALYNMRVENLQPPVVNPQTVLPVPFQGPLVGGPDWTASSVLAGTIAQGTGIVDPILQVNSNQAAFSLVPGQAIPGALPTALQAPIQTIDGRKVLSKEEFYRLKMEMLDSTRRRHRHHSRSRSPGHSYRRSSRDKPEPSARRSHYERGCYERRSRYRSPADYESEQARRRYYEPDPSCEMKRDREHVGYSRSRLVRTRGDSSDLERYYQEDRRYVRTHHLRSFPSHQGSQPRDEVLCFSPRAHPASPKTRRQEDPHRFREPHMNRTQYEDRDAEHHEILSPHPASVVPQYDLSETESVGSRPIPVAAENSDQTRQSYSIQTPEEPVVEESPKEMTKWTNQTVEYLGIRDPREPHSQLITAPEAFSGEVSEKKRKKDKKNKKHKHKHHSEKKRSKRARVEGETMGSETELWVASDVNLENTVYEVNEAQSTEAIKKHKKHHKHKHGDKERKKKRKEHKEQTSVNTSLVPLETQLL
ncbi:unnamed protein product [Calicophoron daubneyi]|uniref:E3 ubiquitin-protein ligase RBBP6 n=1 Tax=Calicophoron daubneyi TaxID=300641 RepID=A0AAV2TRU7_CALDB